jgi:hypothetical protein
MFIRGNVNLEGPSDVFLYLKEQEPTTLRLINVAR